MEHMQFTQEEREYMGLIRRLFEDVFLKGKLSVANDILSPDFVLHYPFPWLAPNINGLKEFVTMFHTAFPKFRLTMEDLYAKENKVTIRWTARGTHEGDLLGIPATGRQVTVTAIGMYGGGGGGGGAQVFVVQAVGGKEIDDDRRMIVEGWINMDVLGMFQQLGIVRQYIDLLPKLRK